MAEASGKLSTSALARFLELPVPQLFAVLKDYGWIRKVEDGWVLTAKGEFEGGEYVHSQRYGRYIVWPEQLREHPLLLGLESNRRLSCAQLARQFELDVRQVQRVLAERGLLRRGGRGWQLTVAGEHAGGLEFDSEHNGLVHSLWPEDLLQQVPGLEVLFHKLQRLQQVAQTGAAEPQDDLFGADAAPYVGLDGHTHASCGELLICNWLYLAGIPHACGRDVPGLPGQRADFFLPRDAVSIEYLGDEGDARSLSATLERLEHYRRSQWPCLEVRPEHLPGLGNYLEVRLQRLGVEVL